MRIDERMCKMKAPSLVAIIARENVMAFSLSGHPFNLEAIMYVNGSTGWQYDVSPRILTYSFSSNSNAQFRSITQAALNELAGYLNVSFQRVADEAEYSGSATFKGVAGNEGSADLRLSQQTSTAGFAGSADSWFWDLDGDADIEDIDALMRVWTVDEYTILHELGHALTLHHTSPNQNPVQAPFLPTDKQNNNYTVMHYNTASSNQAYDAAQGEWLYKHYQLYDVYALQQRFGANMSTYAGNTVHTMSSLGVSQWLKVLWDAGGTDTIDMSGQTRSQYIDLNRGGFSNIGATAGNNPYGYNLAIALNAAIEHANGGSANDTLIGNATSNILNGKQGADVMRAGAGNDIYYVDNSGDVIIETATGGIDRVYSSISKTLETTVENLFLTGSAAINGYGSDSNVSNIIAGNSGNNYLDGRGGADSLFGNGGNDKIRGGSERDVFYGDDEAGKLHGADVFEFQNLDFGGATAATADRIVDFDATDKIDLAGVDAITGGADNAFVFIGAGAFTGAAGQLRYQYVNGSTAVQGDMNGDKVADFWIMLDGTHALVAGQFIL